MLKCHEVQRNLLARSGLTGLSIRPVETFPRVIYIEGGARRQTVQG